MEQKVKFVLDNMQENGGLSVLKITYINFNGEEKELEKHREALTPLEKEKAREILPPHLFSVVDALWTPEIMTAWENSQKNLHEIN